MTTATLRDILRNVLRTSLAAPLVLSGCGPDLAEYSQPACSEGFLALSGINPAMQVDYAELRLVNDFGNEPPEMARAVATTGTKCQTATDRAACEATLGQLSSQGGFAGSCFDFCSRYYLAVTSGNDVRAIDSEALWRAFLGPIDTGQEAALLAWSQDFDIGCSDKERGAVRQVPGGHEVIATTGFACGPGTELRQHVLEVAPDGTLREVSSRVLERGDPNCAIGRRPAGLRRSRRVPVDRAGSPVGRFFADAARLEAASVDAFLTLLGELRRHGADETLLCQALMAAADEVRHARITAALARRHGTMPTAPRVTSGPPRPLEEVALENATEGCVRETYGALCATWQAARAGDAVIARAMAGIAADETRHAALGWQVAEFAERRLGAAARRRLRAQRRHAVAALRAELCDEPHDELVAVAGLPRADEALGLLDHMARALPLS